MTRRSAPIERLIEKGKIRYVGASNLDAGQLRGGAEGGKPEEAAALRGAAAGIQSLRPLELRRAAARPLHQRKRSASSPISASPRAFCPANTAARPISAKARAAAASRSYLDARGKRILAALDAVSARHAAKQAEVALAWVDRAAGRHRADRQRDDTKRRSTA